MGSISSTYSYESKNDAIKKMLDVLDDKDIRIYYSGDKYLYFIVEYPKIKRYLRVRKKKDYFGCEYYECYIDND